MNLKYFLSLMDVWSKQKFFLTNSWRCLYKNCYLVIASLNLDIEFNVLLFIYKSLQNWVGYFSESDQLCSAHVIIKNT